MSSLRTGAPARRGYGREIHAVGPAEKMARSPAVFGFKRLIARGQRIDQPSKCLQGNGFIKRAWQRAWHPVRVALFSLTNSSTVKQDICTCHRIWPRIVRYLHSHWFILSGRTWQKAIVEPQISFLQKPSFKHDGCLFHRASSRAVGHLRYFSVTTSTRALDKLQSSSVGWRFSQKPSFRRCTSVL